MSVILLSDRSVLGSSDEHRAFDFTRGRRLTPVECQAIPQNPAAEPPRVPPHPKQPRTQPPAADASVTEKKRDNPTEIPSSGYLPGSG